MNQYAVCGCCLMLLLSSITIYSTTCSNRRLYAPIAPNYYDMLGISYDGDISRASNASRIYQRKKNCSLCQKISTLITNATNLLNNPIQRIKYNRNLYVPRSNKMVYLSAENFNLLTLKYTWIIFVEPRGDLDAIIFDEIHVGYISKHDNKLFSYLNLRSYTQYFIYSPYKIIEFAQQFNISTIQSDITENVLKALPIMTYDNINEVLKYEIQDVLPYEIPPLTKFCFAYAPESISNVPFEYIMIVLKYGDRIDFSLISDYDRHRILWRFNKHISFNTILSHVLVSPSYQLTRKVLSTEFHPYELGLLGNVLTSHTIIPLFQDNLRSTCLNKYCIILLYSSSTVIYEDFQDIMLSFQKKAIQNFAEEIDSRLIVAYQFAIIDLDWHPKLKTYISMHLNDTYTCIAYRFDVNSYSQFNLEDTISGVERDGNLMELNLGPLLKRSDSYISVNLYNAFGYQVYVLMVSLILGWMITRRVYFSVLLYIFEVGVSLYLIAKPV